MIDLNILRGVRMFQTVSEKRLRELQRVLKEATFSKGTELFTQGDPGNCLYIIIKGRVRIYINYSESNEAFADKQELRKKRNLRQTQSETTLVIERGKTREPAQRYISLRVYGPGHSIGEFALLDGKPRSTSADALDDVEVYSLDYDEFWHILQDDFDFVKQVILILTERLRYTTKYAQYLISLNATERCLLMLYHLSHSEYIDGKPTNNVKISQEGLANLVGVHRSWLNSELQLLSSANNSILPLISIAKRGYITILDHSRLKDRLKKNDLLEDE